MRALFLALLACLSLTCRAEPTPQMLAQAKAAFERQLPGRLYHGDPAFGDLNGDGVPDFVTSVGGPLDNESGTEGLRMAAFLGSKDGTFTFYDMSRDTFAHERVSQDVEIKRQSVFLHRDGSGGCCSHWREEFQFKIRDGQLMLIGVETGNYHPEGIQEPDTGISANLVTGRVMKWTGTDKKRRETWKTVPGLKPMPFKDFSYDGVTEKWGRDLW